MVQTIIYLLLLEFPKLMIDILYYMVGIAIQEIWRGVQVGCEGGIPEEMFMGALNNGWGQER